MSDITSDRSGLRGWQQGVIYGFLAALMWALFMIATRVGTVGGLMPPDLLVLRFGTAALLVLPWVIHRGFASLAGVGWHRGVALSLFAGPPFFVLTALGYNYAPLAHGAVIQPSTAALTSLLGAAFLLGERIPLVRAFGAALIVTGLSLIALGQSGVPLPGAWRGDVLFVGAGLCWTVFTLLLKHWRIGGFEAAAAIAVISGLSVVPVCLVLFDADRIIALPPATLVMQMIVQGLFASVLAILAFGRAVMLLGAGTAALFPAFVPTLTLVLGIPLSGEVPSMTEMAGAVLATIGLIIALGVITRLRT